MPHSNKIIIFSAPSGAGKTTIVKKLLAQHSEFSFSVSATTRPRRTHEEEGKDYYFLELNDFEKRIEAGDFIEYEEVYQGMYYGTLKAEVARLHAKGKVVIFDVDVVGGRSLKKYFGEKALTVFVKVESLAVLEERLRLRQTETPETIAKRLAKAEEEMKHEPHFDFVLLNQNLDQALEEVNLKIKAFLEK